MLTTCMNCGHRQDSSLANCAACGRLLTSSTNPYSSPAAVGPVASPFQSQMGPFQLADVWARFVAQVVDGMINFAVSLPGIVLIIVAAIQAGPDEDPGPLFYIGLVLVVVASLGFNIYQWVLISRDGQSIGKRLMKIRIIMFGSGLPPGFVHGVLLRIWVNGMLSGLPCGIGIVYTLTDIGFILRSDRRCIHDLLAQTVVVQA